MPKKKKFTKKKTKKTEEEQDAKAKSPKKLELKETEEESKDKESELDAKPINSEEESELEEELEEAEEDLQKQQFSNFIPIQGKISAPVLEQIADVPQTPDIDWQLSPQREEEEEKKDKKQDYQLEEQTSKDYELPKQELGLSAPVLKAERVDFEKINPISTSIGREFKMQGFAEPSTRDDEYQVIDAPRGFKPEKEKPRIGREYKPKAR